LRSHYIYAKEEGKERKKKKNQDERILCTVLNSDGALIHFIDRGTATQRADGGIEEG
jgi:hypothetical protein